MDTPSSPGALKEAWRALVDSIKAGEPALGERVYLLGAGPVPIAGAVGGALTVAGDGAVILVVGLAGASEGAAAEITRQLEGIERLPGAKLREAGVDPASGGGLAARHARFFDLDEPLAELNTAQRCVVVLDEPASSGPGADALSAALGPRLHGVFVATAGGVTPLAPPDVAEPEAEITLEPETTAEAEPETTTETEPETTTETGAEASETEPAPADEAEAPEIEASTDTATPAVETETPTEVSAGDVPAPAGEAPEAGEAAPEGDAADTEAEGPAEIETALDDAPPLQDTGDTGDTGDAGDAGATGDTATAAVVEAATGQPSDVFDAYLADESATVITEESDQVEKTGVAAWPIGNWIGLSMVLVGVALLIVGVITVLNGGEAPSDATDDPPLGEPNALIRTVASNVPTDATHGRWIGQQRVVTLSDGTLAFVYATQESLNVVKDEADGGETWGEPFALTEMQPTSLSVDVDSKDRLHVAYSDGASVNYVRLKNKPAAWKPSRIVQLDDATTSLNVDVAWDEQNQAAHVVWVQQSDDGEAPAWAALTNEGGIHLTEEGILAQPARDVPVLASVAADGRSSLLITYRRGDQTTGWSSRYSAGRDADGTWLFEEEEAVPLSSFVGAADVIYDRQKTAHLILRDSTNFALTYFSKRQNEPWTQGEVAHEATAVSMVEFPALSTTATTKHVYVFFQTDQFDPAGEVAYVVRDPDGTWSEPLDIVSPADAPAGAQYPVAPDRVDEQAVVFWTKTGESYQVDTIPVSAP